MRKVALLFSSGVESTCLTVYYLKKGFLVYPLYVRSGFGWESAERSKAIRLWVHLRNRYSRLLPLKTLFLKGVPPSRGDIEIPLRNLLLVTSVAAESCRKGIRRVGIGSLGIYPFPDTSRSYFDALEGLIETALRRRFKVETPFLGKDKAAVIKEFHNQVPFDLTFSCILPSGGMHCGTCAKCAERKEGFLQAGVPDPTRYLSEAPVSSVP